MDPLSLTCSVVALTQAASSIASSLYTAVEALRTADERIASLCDEVQNLAGFLNAIDKALTECGSIGTTTVGEDLWRRSELTLKDIGTTLREMELLVYQIKENAGDRPYGRSLKRRTRIAIDLNIHGTTLLSFRDRILKSNWALQTILNTIAVSVSLRNSASQNSILMALNKLRKSVDDAFHASARPNAVSMRPRALDQFDLQMAQNLRKLAEAAQTFHTTASATASTIHGGSVRVDPWDGHHSMAAMSIAGDLSPFQRERIEGYIDGQIKHCLNDEAYSTLIPVLPEDESETKHYERYASTYEYDQPEHEYYAMDGDDDSELEELFVDNLIKLGENHIRDGMFAKAKECLHEALQQNFDVVSHSKLRHLHVLWSFCDIMQGDWKLAEPLVVELEKSEEYEYLEAAGRLLHAVTLGHLNEFSFGDAEKQCRRVWNIRKRILRHQDFPHNPRDKYHCDNALGLLATIYEMKGDYRRAGILRGEQPDFVYRHPASEADYLLEYDELLGIDLHRFLPKSNNWNISCTEHPSTHETVDGTYHLLGGGNTAMANDMHHVNHDHMAGGLVRNDGSRLGLSQDQWERLEIDTSKEVYIENRPSSPMVLDGVDVVGDLTNLSPQRMSSLHRKLSKILQYRKAQDAGEDIEMIRIRVNNDADGSGQANTSKTDLTRWLSKRSRLFRKSKTLLRKRLGDIVMVDWEDSACFASLSTASNSGEDGAKISDSVLAQSATVTRDIGTRYSLQNTTDDSGHDSGYGTECGDQYIPSSNKASLMTLVLRHMDYLYATDTTRPDWLDDLVPLVEDWSDTLEDRYPAWGGRLGRIHQDQLRDLGAAEETQNAAENLVLVGPRDRVLRRASSWVSGSEERCNQRCAEYGTAEGTQIDPDYGLPAELEGSYPPGCIEVA